MRPVAQPERYAPLDILRGVALFGVLIVNLLSGFRDSLAAHIAEGGGGGTVETLVSLLIEFKAFALFSFVFGVGVAVQSGRAGQPARFLARRFFGLLVIGLIHLLLVWNGDILTFYAVCGLLLIPLLRLPDPALAVIGAAAIVIPHFAPMAVALPDKPALHSLGEAARNIYAQGSAGEILAFRWKETRELIFPLLVLSLPKTLGLMMWGVAAWRRGLLQERRALWLRLFFTGAAVGVAGTLLRIDAATHVPIALAYAAAILLWLPRAPLLAAAGQMALTNYLLQSVVFALVFYSFGLGLYGRLGVTESAILGVTLYVAQLLFSRWWLNRFHFGPCEWLWRSFTYGRPQPMLKDGALTISRGGLRVMLWAVCAGVVPLVHLGVPWLIARQGPPWGWRAGSPGLLNLTGLLFGAAALGLLGWILTTMLAEVPSMPPRVQLGLRPVRLVRSGPYARMRHPIYLAETLLWLACAVFLGSWLVLTVLAGLLVLGRLFLIPREEAALEKWFGKEYLEYKRAVPGIDIPWPLK